MTRRDSFRKPKGNGRSRKGRVSDPNIYYPYSPHPQGTAIPSSAPRRASVASYTTQPYRHRSNSSRDPQKQAYAGHPHPSRPIEPHEPFLKDDEDLRPKALQHPYGTTTGFTAVNKDKPGANNTYAPLPLSNGGIGFDVDNETSAIAAYEPARGASVSGKVPDIMFSPPCDTNGAALRDVDWSRLVHRPAVKEINEADGGFRLSELKSFVPEIPAPPGRLRKH